MKKIILLGLTLIGINLLAQNTLPSTRVAGSIRVDSTITVKDSVSVLKNMNVSGETTLKDTVHVLKDVIVDGSISTATGMLSPVYRVGTNANNYFDAKTGANFSAINFGSIFNNSAPSNPSCVPNYPANGTILANRMIVKDQSGLSGNTFDFRNDGWNGFIDYPTVASTADGVQPHYIKVGDCDNTNVEMCVQANYNSTSAGFVSIGRNLELGVPTRVPTTAFNVNLKAGITKAVSIYNPASAVHKEIFRILDNGQTGITYAGTFITPAFMVSNATPSPTDGSYPPFFTVMGDGKVIISKPNASTDNDALVIKNPANGQIDYKVKNDGSVYARYMKVSLGNFPDYVFENSYKLMPLKEVDAYIKENKHLPNIPTAKTVETEGADLGELQRLNIEKTEEIYLYLIEMNKRIEKLEAENAALKNQLLKK